MAINSQRKYCFRITHRDNLPHILQHGLVTKHHPNADPNFVPIGNPEIIDVRSTTPVDFDGYGNIGDYVPFYFTPRSIMLYNIVTGYYTGKVQQRSRKEIIVLRCHIEKLAGQPRWFFTEGQANDRQTTHYNDLADLNEVDWDSIQQSNFTKSDGDYDRPRRYQAEFLVYDSVPVDCIESVCVYNDATKQRAEKEIAAAGLTIPVLVHKPYLFD